MIDPANRRDAVADVLVADGKIAAVGSEAVAKAPPDAARLALPGLVVCPGLIDLHVHLREPGHLCWRAGRRVPTHPHWPGRAVRQRDAHRRPVRLDGHADDGDLRDFGRSAQRIFDLYTEGFPEADRELFITRLTPNELCEKPFAF